MDTFNVYMIEDLKNLPKDGKFHLKVYLTKVEINLKYIHGNCTVKARDVVFPILEKVGGSCYFVAEEIKTPRLREVKGLLHLNKENDVPKKLREVGGLFIDSADNLIFDSLEKINGHLVDLGNNLQVPRLTFIKKDAVLKGKLYAPLLKRVEGKLYLLNGLDKPLSKLEYVSRFLSKEIKNDEFTFLFPSLKRIKEHYFKRYNPFIDKIVDKPLYPLKGFIINKLGESNIYHKSDCKMTSNEVVSILKLHHSTYDDFFKEEFEKQWYTHFPSKKLLSITDKLKEQWDSTFSYTFENFLENGTEFITNLRCYLDLKAVFRLFGSQKVDSTNIELKYRNLCKSRVQKVTYKQTNLDIHVINITPRLKRLMSQFICLYPCAGNAVPHDLNGYNIYALRQWSIKSSVENWRIIGFEYKGNPLDSLLSTFIVDENIVSKIEKMYWDKYGARYFFDKNWNSIHITRLSSNPRPISREEFLNWIEVHE